ncbi:T9SS type A sorting domain-containing protein [Hymenobacter sp. YC55]|uniref:beta strand repeat-containing protein n=1 Tax=Hymenobacter sp. YC55 TaxID=3034019 RepID=UPI0023F71EE0|nr:T9SS type A sorting domain-containing protein [Hymenobacter sp. YC55]MDF7815918.1 T9SS type A sorting domain-containing protein [Hymenobacter sp. YC55]
MKSFDYQVSTKWRNQAVKLLLGGSLLATGPVQAQAPAWVLATSGASGNASLGNGGIVAATAVDAAGNVFITGKFENSIRFGSTILNSAGGQDMFVAKYVPATDTWAWAQRGGGTLGDEGNGIAVSGGSVYVTGYITNNLVNTRNVTLGDPTPVAQYGAVNDTPSPDLLLVKYTDLGTSATLAWSQVAGGAGEDQGKAVAVSGNRVYVAGYIANNRSNDSRVVFGGSGSSAGTASQYGASPSGGAGGFDLVVAKYTDLGSSATFGWSQVGGGANRDEANALAVRGTTVYVAGYIANNVANASGVRFGGTGAVAGTVTVPGASPSTSSDWVVAKYTDDGANATLGWTQVGGGTTNDVAQALAVSGTTVYAAGYVTNNVANANAVGFGSPGATPVPVPGSSPLVSADLLLVKYTDNGMSAALDWTQVGGGTNNDAGQALAVSGNRVYVAGYLVNNAANATATFFGGTTALPGTVSVPGASTTLSADIVVAGYLDNGSAAVLDWAKVGGGAGPDYGYGLAASGNRLYVVGFATPPATFGNYTLAPGPGGYTNFLGALDLSAVLSSTPATVAPAAHLFPNPSAGSATFTGAAPTAPVQILNALGQLVTTVVADTKGTAQLPDGLTPGVYLVRSSTRTVRFIVQ